MAGPRGLYEPAAADALLCVGGGKTLFIGALDDVGWHLHGAPVFIAGLAGRFRLRLPGGDWTVCRSAVIPAGVRHALDLAGEPLAVFYPEPGVAGIAALAAFGGSWRERERILLGDDPEPGMFRELYENAAGIHWSGEALDDLVGHALRRHGGTPLDPRLARVLDFLDAQPDDLTRAEHVARAQGLSVSRFLHLFSEQVGVPFRRYRIWNRVRAAMRLSLDGATFTEAAAGAGFADSAHFARCFRETFGVTPSYVFARVVRSSAMPAARPARLHA
jgi:AraC-like DNA-binding protein